ncbi:MAG: MATE family efflux transporter [Ignavibacteriaceae bacterium]|nr:MATE family efflux transporter [Ignavibacteriaceae bacterium]
MLGELTKIYKKRDKDKQFHINPPVIIGQLGLIMMGVVDSLMVGELGAEYLAAAAISNHIVILILIVAIGVSMAVTPLIAISIGAGRLNEAQILFKQSLIVNICFGITVTILIVIASELIQYLDQPPLVVKYASSYTKVVAVSIIPWMIYQSYKQFVEGLSVTHPPMIVTIVANIVNAIVNWILIYGNLGFPKLNLDGAGIATTLSRIFMMIALILYVNNAYRFKIYDVKPVVKKIDLTKIKKILRLGLPSGFQYFFEVGAFSFAVLMVGWLGAKPLAAHQIAINLASISFMAVTGIAAAGSIRVGNAVGKADISETRKAGLSAVLLGISIMFCSGVIFIFFRFQLAELYISDFEVITITSRLLIIAAIFQVFDGTQAVGIGILRGLTDVKYPTIITFTAYWVISLPIGYILGFTFELGVQGIWIGLLIGLMCSAIMLSLRFNFKSKHRIIT